MPWRVSLVSLVCSVLGMSEREVRRMPLALLLLYANSAAQRSGLETSWQVERKSAEEVHGMVERYRRGSRD